MRIQSNTRNQGNSDQMFKPDTTIEEFIPLTSHVAPMVVKTTGGDYLMVWRLGGLPFVGRDEWEIEHRHNTFNRLLQTLRAPDFVNVAFWVHDIRRKRKIRDRSKFRQAFNQEMSDAYRSEEHTSELQSLMRISYAVFCLKKKNK